MPKKILVVDDEKPISDIIKFNLTKEGFDVDTAYDGEEAVKKVDESTIVLCMAGSQGRTVRGESAREEYTPGRARRPNFKPILFPALDRARGGRYDAGRADNFPRRDRPFFANRRTDASSFLEPGRGRFLPGNGVFPGDPSRGRAGRGISGPARSSGPMVSPGPIRRLPDGQGKGNFRGRGARRRDPFFRRARQPADRNVRRAGRLLHRLDLPDADPGPAGGQYLPGPPEILAHARRQDGKRDPSARGHERPDRGHLGRRFLDPADRVFPQVRHQADPCPPILQHRRFRGRSLRCDLGDVL